MLKVGSGGDAKIVINDRSISPIHAEIEFIDQNEIIIRDLDSENGSYIDGARFKNLYYTKDDRRILKFGNRPIPNIFGRIPAVNEEEIMKILIETYQANQLVSGLLKKSIRKINNVPRVLSFLVSVGATICCFIFKTSNHMIYVTPLAGSIPLVFSGLNNDKLDELTLKLKNQDIAFSRKYCCPGCKKSLGLTPPEQLMLNRYCPEQCGYIFPNKINS
jgi:hypothetical protein